MVDFSVGGSVQVGALEEAVAAALAMPRSLISGGRKSGMRSLVEQEAIRQGQIARAEAALEAKDAARALAAGKSLGITPAPGEVLSSFVERVRRALRGGALAYSGYARKQVSVRKADVGGGWVSAATMGAFAQGAGNADHGIFQTSNHAGGPAMDIPAKGAVTGAFTQDAFVQAVNRMVGRSKVREHVRMIVVLQVGGEGPMLRDSANRLRAELDLDPWAAYPGQGSRVDLHEQCAIELGIDCDWPSDLSRTSSQRVWLPEDPEAPRGSPGAWTRATKFGPDHDKAHGLTNCGLCDAPLDPMKRASVASPVTVSLT